ncbi:Alpha/Beta hydrolase protein [Endogone sp. FLAS-F59071]|nr:Alpha/Beta hydrolase protein [Endogone sp. FLAS-F59071]|eukprot:RUS15465.1 Alpha/Beta hydrolase protein [Endogone sp. FLAS-F59071]
MVSKSSKLLQGLLFYSYAGAIYIRYLIVLSVNLLLAGIPFFPKIDRSQYEKELFEEDGEYGHHRYIEVSEGKKFHIVETGDSNGPLILFLHGFPQFWYTWRNQLKGLRNEGYHIVAMDMVRVSVRYKYTLYSLKTQVIFSTATPPSPQRGYGGSYTPSSLSEYKSKILVSDVRSMIRALVAPTLHSRAAALVGHDWGGIIAQQVAHDSWLRDQARTADDDAQVDSGYIDKLVVINVPHPEVIGRNIARPLEHHLNIGTLVSLMTSPRATWARIWPELAPIFRQLRMSHYIFMFGLPSPLPELACTMGDQYFFQKALKYTAPKDRPNPEAIERYKAQFYGVKGRKRLTAAIAYYKIAATSDRIGVIGYPTLFLWGEDDIALQSSLCLDGVELFYPHVTVTRLPGVNHFVPEEEPEIVNEALRQFVMGKQ